MKIILFGGTTEGRLLARELTGLGHVVTVSVATAVGAEGLRGLTVHVGRLEAEDMAELIHGQDLCIDATHPYAQLARDNIQTACLRANVPLRRLSRPQSDREDCVTVESCREAAAYLASTEGNILLTTGAKELESFEDLDPARLYARILPTHESLSACESLGLPHRNILALWGPFSAELNAALLRQYSIKYMVTKDGGKAGGFPEKIQAAKETGTAVLLIRRPEDSGLTADELLRELIKGENL